MVTVKKNFYSFIKKTWKTKQKKVVLVEQKKNANVKNATAHVDVAKEKNVHAKIATAAKIAKNKHLKKKLTKSTRKDTNH
ncbi:MAG: hypothetical protein WCH65_03655 [bacterium]